MSKIEKQTQDEQTPTSAEAQAEQAPKPSKPKRRGKGKTAPKGQVAKATAKPKKQAAPKAAKGKGAGAKGKGEQAPKAAPKRQAAQDSTTEPTGRLFRIARVKTPRGGEAVVGVTLDGRPDAAARRSLGEVPPITSWVEVRATSWAEATAQFRAGQGKKVRAPR
jgi:hypothetical protein